MIMFSLLFLFPVPLSFYPSLSFVCTISLALLTLAVCLHQDWECIKQTLLHVHTHAHTHTHTHTHRHPKSGSESCRFIQHAAIKQKQHHVPRVLPVGGGEHLEPSEGLSKPSRNQETF